MARTRVDVRFLPAPLQEDALARFTALGSAQRGRPEAMATVIGANPGLFHATGVFVWAAEHVGDLTHRMSERTCVQSSFGYVRRFAEEMGLPVYFSWLEGGFEGEMLKENGYGRPHKVETPDGLVTLPRDMKRAKPGTRLRFPQVAASLQTRWCSSALKIDVGRRALNNQARFRGRKVLFVTGERRQESANRARYNQLEAHACDARRGRTARHVDAWRPILHWSEKEVWDIIARHRVVAPVPYRLGWSRSSCMTCIYNSARIWATIAHYFPERARVIAGYKDRFGVTISRKRLNVLQMAATAKPFEVTDLDALRQASQEDYVLPVMLEEGERWETPAGAFGKEGCGSQ